jgi:2-polyprenyl-6-methoxyphenol hydroxylase-like FAD-dependent oxidoreductase
MEIHTMPAQQKTVIVIGGSVAGLATALALAPLGHRVTILERDATPLPETAVEAFEKWNRRGSPQVRHSHAFLARLVNIVRERAPGLLDDFLASGAELMRFEDLTRPTIPNAEYLPEDAEIAMLACRRLTFEWVLRKHILGRGMAALRDGVEVLGLLGQPGAGGAPARVTGVRVRGPAGDETLEADLVVDASGRRSPLARWLEDLGAEPWPEESEPCGIFYSSRFYRLRDGVKPPFTAGFQGADLGYVKCGVFPGDGRIFSITLAANPEDESLSALQREGAFDRTAAALKATQSWVDPAVSEPISRVHGMSDLRNTRRFPMRDGEPRTLGVIAVGDALIHSNPLNGRGCTLAFISAYELADALAAHPDDLRALAIDVAERVEREVVPWYESTRIQDRDAIEVGEAQRRGENPFAIKRSDGTNDPKAYMRSLLRDGLIPALAEDIVVARAFMRVGNMLEAPANLMARPDLLQRVLASHARRDQRDPLVHGPNRRELIELLQRAA